MNCVWRGLNQSINQINQSKLDRGRFGTRDLPTSRPEYAVAVTVSLAGKLVGILVDDRQFSQKCHRTR